MKRTKTFTKNIEAYQKHCRSEFAAEMFMIIILYISVPLYLNILPVCAKLATVNMKRSNIVIYIIYSSLNQTKLKQMIL